MASDRKGGLVVSTTPPDAVIRCNSDDCGVTWRVIAENFVPRVLFSGELLHKIAAELEALAGWRKLQERGWCVFEHRDGQPHECWHRKCRAAASGRWRQTVVMLGTRPIDDHIGIPIYGDLFIGGVLKINADNTRLIYRITGFDEPTRMYVGEWPD